MPTLISLLLIFLTSSTFRLEGPTDIDKTNLFLVANGFSPKTRV